MFRVTDPTLIGRPENPPAFPIVQVFEVGGQSLEIPVEPVQLNPHAADHPAPIPLEVIPPAWLQFESPITLFAPGKSHPVNVTLTAARTNLSGTVRLEMPADWHASPLSQPFNLGPSGDRKAFSFVVTAPPNPASAKVIATVEINGVTYRHQREEIAYPHIPRQLLQPPASFKALSLDLATRGHAIGYLPGAGDPVARCIQQMGYTVTTLDDVDLTPDKLKDFDAVVLGVRAFNVRTNLAPHLAGLFAYLEAGGTVVVQYNRPEGLQTNQIAPFNLHLVNQRVTDETAAMTFLAPSHPVLNQPNKITNEDFDHWVQERGIYFPDQWDGHFTPILACHDPGESPLTGSLLVAPYGKGYFVYTSLVFFRELPAGVPGAYRLFANLLSLGK
jgi:hypothetical protein